MTFNKPCLDCGALSKKTRCPSCQKGYLEKKDREGGYQRRGRKAHLYGGDYTKRAKQVRATAIICHLCGGGAREGAPWVWEADHLYPELGNNSPLAPAHRVCNQKRGNKPLSQP
jgi:uncharacterized C2H2 Zn-finger protein